MGTRRLTSRLSRSAFWQILRLLIGGGSRVLGCHWSAPSGGLRNVLVLSRTFECTNKMSFFPSSDNPTRRFRPRRDILRDSSPESDMFFESSPAFGLARSHLADRLGSSVFEDFPTRRTMRSFPSDTPTFTSLHRHRQHPAGWGAASENLGSQESSPVIEGREANVRHPFFQRSESIPVRVSHESCHGSRASTPESTGSGHSHASSSHSRPHSNGPDPAASDGAYDDGGAIPEGVEEHPGVASKTGRPSFTARRQPKVHHIPIHVEPRDGSHPVVLTPPAESTNSRAPPPDLAAASRESLSTPQRKAAKQVFAMPPVPPSGARDCPDSRNNSSNNGSNGNNNSSNNNAAPTEDASSLPVKKSASRERVVPIAVHGNDAREQTPSPVVNSEKEATATLPAPEKKKKSAEELVEEVRLDVEQQRRCVDEFTGIRGDKQYLYLDEMLTRDLIKLDNVSTEGNEKLKKARRAVIVAINGCIQALEQKVSNAEGGSGDVEMDVANENGGEDQRPLPSEEMEINKDVAAGPPANGQGESLSNDAPDELEAQESAIENGATEEEQQQSAEREPLNEEAGQQQQTPKAEETAMEAEVSDAVAAPVPVETSV